MSTYTPRLKTVLNPAALLMMRIPGVRNPEDAQSATISSLNDLPPVYPGTVDYYSSEREVYFSNQREYFESGSAPTATSTIVESEKIRFPVVFKPVSDEMTRLEKVAESGNEVDFIEVAKKTAWTDRSPDDIIRGIQLAFQAGAHLFARKLATEGARQYPDHQELQKYARILAPPRVIKNNLPPDLTIRANREWLKAHWGEYKGQWIALRNGDLLGIALTLGELKDQIGQTDGILFTQGL